MTIRQIFILRAPGLSNRLELLPTETYSWRTLPSTIHRITSPLYFKIEWVIFLQNAEKDVRLENTIVLIFTLESRGKSICQCRLNLNRLLRKKKDIFFSPPYSTFTGIVISCLFPLRSVWNTVVDYTAEVIYIHTIAEKKPLYVFTCTAEKTGRNERNSGPRKSAYLFRECFRERARKKENEMGKKMWMRERGDFITW